MCATSMGLTFSHSPVPGERKSGILDGTEIPAPVSATTDLASRTSDARRSIAVASLSSASLPLRLALAQAGAYALLGVRASEDAGEGGLLLLDALVEVAGGADLLDLGQRQRRRLAQLARPRQRRVEQLVVRHRAVHQPELIRLVRADRAADHGHL